MEMTSNDQMVFCRACGHKIHNSAPSCPSCGALQKVSGGGSDKRILPALLLCFFFGLFGVHRFYVGKTGTGVLQFFTFGGLGVWVLIDFVMIVCGSFTDKQGNFLKQWT
ncbi:hypothetical protein GCM10007875_15980 [Limnobacter litoralis]|uniref:TM2 domain-containing protein n=2 Tax=Limnobacter litoralis TaxID=481366 RepID=A0ABQ5YPI7_9BURK|nr:hypothetical protein GCM10007875_15980 [Limnobacter litoralis]